MEEEEEEEEEKEVFLRLSVEKQSVIKYKEVYKCFKVMSLEGHIWKGGYLFMTQHTS